MYINRLRIKNFGNISEIGTTFSKLNLVMGDNGSGKSKFLSAIVYSLCDYLDEKISDYIRTGSKSFEIESDFTHANVNYNLFIEGSHKGSEKILKVNNSDIYKNSQAVEYIDKYIHNSKLTLASAITMQGKGSDILFEPNQKRVERLKQIFNIDRLNEVGIYIKDQIDEMKVRIKELETENNVLSNTVYDFKKEPEKPNEKHLSEIKLKKSELEKEKSEYEKNKILYDLYCKELKVYENAQTKLISLENSIITIQSDIDDIKNRIVTDYKDIKSIKEEQSDLSDRISEYRSKISIIDNYNTLIEQKSKIIQKQKDVILKREPRLPECDLDALKKELLDVSNKYYSLVEKRELVKQGKCPTCGQDYNLCESIEDFELSVSELEQVKYEKDTQLRGIEKAIEDYNEVKRYNENAKNTISLFQDQIDQIIENLKVYGEYEIEDKNEVLNNIKNLEDSYIILDKEIEKSEQIIKTNTMNESYSRDLNYELQDALKEIESLKTIQKPVDVIAPETFNQTLYEEICMSVDLYEKAFSDYDNIIAYNKMIAESRITNDKKIDVNQKELDKLRNSSKLKESVKKIIEKDFASWLIANGSQYVQEKMNQFFQKSYGKFNIELRTENKSADFYYSEDSNEYLNVALASGHEKESLAVAFRVALCFMQSLGFIILDEIDSFSSADNSLRMYDAILQEDFNQVFAITHCDETKEFLMGKKAKIIELYNGGSK